MEVPTHNGDWYRQPVAWLGVVLLAASLLGCILMIVLAGRHEPPPGPDSNLRILDVPLT